MSLSKKEFIEHMAARFARQTGEAAAAWWNYAEQIYDADEEKDDPDFVRDKASADEMAENDMLLWDESTDAAEA